MKRRNHFALLLLATCFALALATPALAQKITGEITGTIMDATGGALPGASVTATCTGTGLTRSTVSGATGGYTLPELPICVYRVAVAMQGFKTTTREVQVAVNNVTKADFRLSVGQMAEEVTVEAAVPLVEFSDKLNNYVDRARIDSLPLNGRDFNSLLGITPGVQRAPGGGFLAVNISGQRRTANNYQLDGMPNNDRYYGDSLLNQTGVVGTPATLVPMDAIAEFTVQQTPAAEFGVKGGAAINVVLKSGSNAFHGSAHLYYADDFANAANYFNKSTGPEGCKGSACGDRTAMSNKQFGGTFGGPIVKDKTFFFGFYEAQRLKTQSPYTAFVPTPDQVAEARARIAGAGLRTNSAGEALLAFYPVDPGGEIVVRTPTVADSNTFSLKLDHRFNEKHQISARYIYGSAYQSNTAFVGTLSPPPPNPPDLFNSVLEPKTSAQLLGVNFTSSHSENKIFEARVNWTRFRNVLTPNNKIDPKSLGLDTGPLDPEDFGVPAIYYLSYFGYVGGVGGYPITTAPTDTLDVSAHHTWIKDRHTLKVGGNFQRATSFNLRNRARSVFYIGQATGDPIDALVGLLLGRFDSAARSFGSTRRTLEQNSFGVYVSDDWKLSPRFTVSLGLRYDWSAPLGEKDNIGANFFADRGLVTLGEGIDQLYTSDRNNFGPRVGFAWDVNGNGRTALRGGYSLTYDIPNFGSIHAPRTAFLGARGGAFTQPNLGIFSVLLEGDLAVAPDDPSATCVDPTTGEGNFVCVGPGIPIYGANPGSSPPFNAFSVDPNLKTPTLHTYHLTLQREVFKNNVVTLSYVGSQGRDLLMYRDINGPPIGGGPRPFASQYPDLEKIVQLTNAAKSWYDSVQVSWRQSNWKGINTQYNFTWGKCFDYASINRGSRTNFPQSNNPFRPELNKGRCDHDIRYNFNAGGTFNIPAISGLGQAGQGWQIATVFTGLSGRAYTPHLGARDRSGQGGINAIRANCNGTIRYNTRDPNNYIANAAEVFSQPADGTIGTCGRNIIDGPGLTQWDVSLLKDTKINDKVKLQFRWEVFNVLNRANFSGDSANYSIRSAAFAELTATPDVSVGNPVLAQGGPRAMQFVLKLLF